MTIPDIAYASIRMIGPQQLNYGQMLVNYETLSNNIKKDIIRKEHYIQHNEYNMKFIPVTPSAMEVESDLIFEAVPYVF